MPLDSGDAHAEPQAHGVSKGMKGIFSAVLSLGQATGQQVCQPRGLRMGFSLIPSLEGVLVTLGYGILLRNKPRPLELLAGRVVEAHVLLLRDLEELAGCSGLRSGPLDTLSWRTWASASGQRKCL